MDEREKRINLHATPEQMAGVYANFANVSHSDYEFSITFVRLDHEGNEGEEAEGDQRDRHERGDHPESPSEGEAQHGATYASGRRRGR